ncbi:vitamin K epoxide reductase family protein [Foetidibacter luteolus]|uniref:vitamin K epoxide reductase family protein n=1 Tax=Foetidibacter luteolus TaxID=2608880 RepID=UPI00129B4A21|nr:vitamin K epoxide reductase family protein [Foetidibacter luteolus]
MNKNSFHSLEKQDRNVLYVTAKLLEILKVNVTVTSIQKALLSHPHHLSLFSINESLQKWKLDTYPLKIQASDLADITCPFIAYLWHGRKFIVIVETSDDAIWYFDDEDKKRRMEMADFLLYWDGVMLAAEATAQSGEKDYKALLQKEKLGHYKIPGLVVGLVLLLSTRASFVFLTNVETEGLYFTLLAACKITGLCIALILLLHDYDSQNALLKQLCSSGKKTNCSAVLSSKAAKTVGGLSWSEVGFIYFMGGALFLLMAGTAALPLMFWLNIAALPYVIFSVTYQAVKVKQWCVLCLVTQILLVTEFLSVFAASNGFFSLSGTGTQDTWLLLVLSFFIPSFAWFFSKQYVYSAKTKNKLEYLLARFKNSPEVFYAMLHKQVPVTSQPQPGEVGITLGNPAASNTLIKVCNPYCGPCAKAHPEIEELIHNNDNWKVQIIFSAKAVENDLKFIAATHLMSISEIFEKENKSWMKTRALDDWYLSSYPSNQEKYDVFAAKYPVNIEVPAQKARIAAMYKWCEANGIMFTPTFFVNGYHLPEQYNISDLQYL